MYTLLFILLFVGAGWLFIRNRKDSLTHIFRPTNSEEGTRGVGYDAPDTELTESIEDEIKPH